MVGEWSDPQQHHQQQQQQRYHIPPTSPFSIPPMTTSIGTTDRFVRIWCDIFLSKRVCDDRSNGVMTMEQWKKWSGGCQSVLLR